MKYFKYFFLSFIIFISFGFKTVSASDFPAENINTWVVSNAYADIYVAINSIEVTNQNYFVFYFGENNYTAISAGGIDSNIVFYDGNNAVVDTFLLNANGWLVLNIDNSVTDIVITFAREGLYSAWGTSIENTTYGLLTNDLGAFIEISASTSTYDKGYSDAVDFYNDNYSFIFDSNNDGFDDVSFVAGSNSVSAEIDFDDVLNWVFLPFDILNIHIFGDITFGHIAFVSIMFGLITFLFKFKGGR